MIGCLLDPASCVPDWIKLVYAHWDDLLLVFLIGVVVGAMGGWKALLVALTGGLVLLWRKQAAAEPDYETGEPPPPKPPRSAASRGAGPAGSLTSND